MPALPFGLAMTAQVKSSDYEPMLVHYLCKIAISSAVFTKPVYNAYYSAGSNFRLPTLAK